MKVGDLVRCGPSWSEGIIVGFNKKGEGGKDYVHILVDGSVGVYLSFGVEVVDEGRRYRQVETKQPVQE